MMPKIEGSEINALTKNLWIFPKGFHSFLCQNGATTKINKYENSLCT
jgi:hypothetical protein